MLIVSGHFCISGTKNRHFVCCVGLQLKRFKNLRHIFMACRRNALKWATQCDAMGPALDSCYKYIGEHRSNRSDMGFSLYLRYIFFPGHPLLGCVRH